MRAKAAMLTVTLGIAATPVSGGGPDGNCKHFISTLEQNLDSREIDMFLRRSECDCDKVGELTEQILSRIDYVLDPKAGGGPCSKWMRNDAYIVHLLQQRRHDAIESRNDCRFRKSRGLAAC